MSFNKIKYPLVGKENCSQADALNFEQLLKKECEKLQALKINEDFNVEYCFAKTKNGKSFGLILSQEERYNHKNFIHKFGYKSYRISFAEDELTDSFLHYYLHTKRKYFELQKYKVLQAYTLDNDSNLCFVGSELYFISKRRNKTYAYLDGLFLRPEFRGKGIASAMQDVVHLLIVSNGAQEISMDIKKDVEYAEDPADNKVNYKTDAYNMVTKKGYKTESVYRERDSYYFLDPLKIDEKDLVLKNTIITSEDFYQVETDEPQM